MAKNEVGLVLRDSNDLYRHVRQVLDEGRNVFVVGKRKRMWKKGFPTVPGFYWWRKVGTKGSRQIVYWEDAWHIKEGHSAYCGKRTGWGNATRTWEDGEWQRVGGPHDA